MSEQYAEGAIAEDGNGNFMVFKYGGWHPANEAGRPLAPIDASAQWGAGARELPNGTIERVGPRGGVTKLGSSNESETIAKLTEGQGKAMLYGSMMAGGERDYQEALRNGYRPTSMRNQIATMAGVIPWDGDFFGRLIRDDVSDQGRQAELRWSEGNLRQLTGATATDPEIARVAAINFDRGNDKLSEQRYRTRADTYQGTRFAAGPGVSELPVYPEQWDPNTSIGPVDPETGLPTYPSINELTAGAHEIPVSASGQSGGAKENALDLEGSNRAEAVAAIERGGWFRYGDEEPFYMPAQKPQFGYVQDGDEVIGTGVVRRPTALANAVEARSEDMGVGRRVDAFVRGAADSMTLGTADEMSAGLNTAMPAERGTIGGWNNGFSTAYRNNVDLARGYDQADAEDMPLTRGAGQIFGAIAGPGAIRAGQFVARAPTLVSAMTRGSMVGAGYGAAYGFGSGEGGIGARGTEAAKDGAVGAVFGGLAPPVVRAAASMTAPLTRPVARWAGDTMRRMVGNPVGTSEHAARVVGRGRNPAGMQADADWFRAQGAEPTLADVGGSVVQSRVRAAATRQTPGREVAENFAAGRRQDAQEFAAGLGERVSPVRMSVNELDTALEDTQRVASAAAFGPIRGDRVKLDGDSIMALRGPEGRTAVLSASRALGSSVDPAEREVAAELARLGDDLIDNPGGIELTIGAVDQMARYLNSAGGMDGNLRRVFGGAGRALRQNARGQNPGYDEALEGYAQRARMGDATELGESFVGNRGDARDFVSGLNAMGDAERGVVGAASRAGIERAAQTPAGAARLLDGLATGSGQAVRAEALLGPAGADSLRQGAQAGRRLLMTGNNVNPRGGSNTNLNASDSDAGRGAFNLIRGRPVEAAMDFLRSRGMDDEMAEEIVNISLDPSRTDEVLRMLSRRYGPTESRRIIERLTPYFSGQLANDS